MPLTLYDTLKRKKETFKPLNKKTVSMYSCGPTVYNYAHIGNLRTYIFNDILKKSLEFLGYKIKPVMNITDVDDKTIRASQEEKVPLHEITKRYEKIFLEDIQTLNITLPNKILRATENIKEMIDLIQKLLNKEYAYKSDDGIYFSISKDKNYGKLAQLEKVKITKARIKSDEYNKENPRDFALWKFHTQDDGDAAWNAPFGKGRPGWHIECSAMSMKTLGEKIDIHTGGIDLIFPHHTNEIAQSECATGKRPFVKYWLHGGFLTLKEDKMSKSLGNVIYLRDIQEKGYSPLNYRYLCLATHYRSQLNFSWENLESAKHSLQHLHNIIEGLKDDKKINKQYINEFKKSLEDDIDMPKALQVLWKLVRDEKASGKVRTIKEMDRVFSLNLLEKDKIIIPKSIQELIKERENARNEKNWQLADKLRNKIQALGYSIDDTPDGVIVRKR